MNITIRTQHFDVSHAIQSFVRNKVESALARFHDEVLSVDVFLSDINGPKGGQDKRVVIRIQLRRRHQIAVESLHDDLYAAISSSSKKARRVVRRKLRKLRKVQRLSLRNLPEQVGSGASSSEPYIYAG